MNTLFFYSIAFVFLLFAWWIILRRVVRRDYIRLGRLSTLASILFTLFFFTYGGFPATYLPDYWPRSIVTMGLRVIGTALI